MVKKQQITPVTGLSGGGGGSSPPRSPTALDGGHRLPSKNDDSEEEVTVRALGLRGCGTEARKAELAEPGAELTSKEGESQEPRS